MKMIAMPRRLNQSRAPSTDWWAEYPRIGGRRRGLAKQASRPVQPEITQEMAMKQAKTASAAPGCPAPPGNRGNAGQVLGDERRQAINASTAMGESPTNAAALMFRLASDAAGSAPDRVAQPAKQP
jgi:hypothetical protein